MNIEQQVCTLEQAKRLLELGVAQNAYFSYQGTVDYEPDLKSDDGKDYAAFTVAELGLMLPPLDNIHWEARHLTPYNGIRRYLHAEVHFLPFGAYDNEASARAAILIHLLEAGNISATAVNNRLKP